MQDARLAQVPEQLDGALKRPPRRHQQVKQLCVAALERIGLFRRERAPDLARDGASEEPAAHADAAMDAPAVDRHPGLGERLLPGKDVRVDGVHERPVEIEDERAHNAHDTSPGFRT